MQKAGAITADGEIKALMIPDGPRRYNNNNDADRTTNRHAFDGKRQSQQRTKRSSSQQ
jgi:hypothetical protein